MGVTVYSKSGCVQSFYVTKYLEKQNINFVEKIVDKNDSFFQEIRIMGYHSIPVTIAEKNAAIVGYQPEKLKELVTSVHQ